MLNRQYGVAASSAVVKVTHPEDNQPNEGLHGRDSRAPPRLADTSQPPRYNRKASFSEQRGRSRPKGPGSTGGSRYGRGQEGSVGPAASASWRRPISNAVPRAQTTRNEHRSTFSSDRRHSSNSLPILIALPTRTRKAPVMGPPLPTRTQQGTSAILFSQKSPSPKLPIEPLRRRTYHELPSRPQLLTQPSGSQMESKRPLLPGRKRPSPDFTLSQPPPSQRTKVDQHQGKSTGSNRVFNANSPHNSHYSTEQTNRTANTVSPATTGVNHLSWNHPNLAGPSSLPHIQPPPTSLVNVKEEPLSPVAAPGPSRKLVTAACKLYALPDNCKKSVPNYKVNRDEFRKVKLRELLLLGLKVVRTFVREDGLVLEWESNVPIWNDTLLPEKSPPRASGTSMWKNTDVEIIDVDDPNLIIAPMKLFKSNASPLSSQRRNQMREIPSHHRPPPPKPYAPRKSFPLNPKAKGKEKVKEPHWTHGLTPEEIVNLGRCVEPRPTSSASPHAHSHQNPSTSNTTGPSTSISRCRTLPSRMSISTATPSQPPPSLPPSQPRASGEQHPAGVASTESSPDPLDLLSPSSSQKPRPPLPSRLGSAKPHRTSPSTSAVAPPSTAPPPPVDLDDKRSRSISQAALSSIQSPPSLSKTAEVVEEKAPITIPATVPSRISKSKSKSRSNTPQLKDLTPPVLEPSTSRPSSPQASKALSSSPLHTDSQIFKRIHEADFSMKSTTHSEIRSVTPRRMSIAEDSVTCVCRSRSSSMQPPALPLPRSSSVSLDGQLSSKVQIGEAETDSLTASASRLPTLDPAAQPSTYPSLPRFITPIYVPSPSSTQVPTPTPAVEKQKESRTDSIYSISTSTDLYSQRRGSQTSAGWRDTSTTPVWDGEATGSIKGFDRALDDGWSQESMKMDLDTNVVDDAEVDVDEEDEVSVGLRMNSELASPSEERRESETSSVSQGVDGCLPADEEVDSSPEDGDGSAEIYEKVVAFLARFTQTFDADRSMLALAYANDASFSCRMHVDFQGSSSSRPSPLPDSTRSSSSRGKIIQQLHDLGTCYFEPRGVPMREARYDLASLSKDMIGLVGGVGVRAEHVDPQETTSSKPLSTIGGILATLHSEIIRPNDEDADLDEVLVINQSFVLRSRVEEDELDPDALGEPSRSLAGEEAVQTIGQKSSLNEDDEEQWPLTIASHQVVIRDGPILSFDKLKSLLPWFDFEDDEEDS